MTIGSSLCERGRLVPLEFRRPAKTELMCVLEDDKAKTVWSKIKRLDDRTTLYRRGYMLANTTFDGKRQELPLLPGRYISGVIYSRYNEDSLSLYRGRGDDRRHLSGFSLLDCIFGRSVGVIKEISCRRSFSPQITSCAVRFSIKPFSRYRSRVRKVLCSVTKSRRMNIIVIILL